MDNQIQTKRQVLEEFIEDINSVFIKVENNTASPQDYQKLEEYFRIGGVPENIINEVKSNFPSWTIFHTTRLLPFKDQDVMAVKETLGALRGVRNGLVELLKVEMDKP